METENRLIYTNDLLSNNVVWNKGGDANDPYVQGYLNALDAVEKAVNETPTAEAEPIIHAEWRMAYTETHLCSTGGDSTIFSGEPLKALVPYCTHCKTAFSSVVLTYKRCPECGAIMDLKED